MRTRTRTCRGPSRHAGSPGCSRSGCVARVGSRAFSGVAVGVKKRNASMWVQRRPTASMVDATSVGLTRSGRYACRTSSWVRPWTMAHSCRPKQPSTGVREAVPVRMRIATSSRAVLFASQATSAVTPSCRARVAAASTGRHRPPVPRGRLRSPDATWRACRGVGVVVEEEVIDRVRAGPRRDGPDARPPTAGPCRHEPPLCRATRPDARHDSSRPDRQMSWRLSRHAAARCRRSRRSSASSPKASAGPSAPVPRA